MIFRHLEERDAVCALFHLDSKAFARQLSYRERTFIELRSRRELLCPRSEIFVIHHANGRVALLLTGAGMRWYSAAIVLLTACVLFLFCPPVTAQKIVVIHAGRLFDGASDALVNNQVILIQGDRIQEVSPEGSVKIPAGAEEIDLRNATVFPGLIDGHTHLIMGRQPGVLEPRLREDMLVKDSWQYRAIEAVVNAKKDLNAGFTTMRDCGSLGARYTDTDVRRAINEGLVPGPRLQVATLPISGTGWLPESGMSPEINVPSAFRFADSPSEGRQAVRENIKYGADLIKIFPNEIRSWFEPDGRLVVPTSMTLQELEAIVDEAHRHGVKAACHAYGGQALSDSVDAGCDSIELGADFDDALARKMAKKNIFAVMTLVHTTYRETAELKETQGKYSRVALQKASLSRLLKAGVKIAFGTDAGSGPDHGGQAIEFKYLVDYGMTPSQSLRAATSVAADLLGWQDRIGTIEKGKYADIDAVAGNPLQDITELSRILFVMKGGEIVRNDLN
jgi:imidazolonepropionase-like amidohydrolase